MYVSPVHYSKINLFIVTGSNFRGITSMSYCNLRVPISSGKLNRDVLHTHLPLDCNLGTSIRI